MTRLPSAERRALVIATMEAMAAAAADQSDFTAAKVAKECGISATMLYRLASVEFRAVRSRLPGARAGDGLVTDLRRAIRDQRTEITALRAAAAAHAACPSADDVALVVDLNERLEVENRSLRAQVAAYRNRLADRPTGERPPRLVALREPDPESDPA